MSFPPCGHFSVPGSSPHSGGGGGLPVTSPADMLGRGAPPPSRRRTNAQISNDGNNTTTAVSNTNSSSRGGSGFSGMGVVTTTNFGDLSSPLLSSLTSLLTTPGVASTHFEALALLLRREAAERGVPPPKTHNVKEVVTATMEMINRCQQEAEEARQNNAKRSRLHFQATALPPLPAAAATAATTTTLPTSQYDFSSSSFSFAPSMDVNSRSQSSSFSLPLPPADTEPFLPLSDSFSSTTTSSPFTAFDQFAATPATALPAQRTFASSTAAHAQPLDLTTAVSGSAWRSSSSALPSSRTSPAGALAPNQLSRASISPSYSTSSPERSPVLSPESNSLTVVAPLSGFSAHTAMNPTALFANNHHASLQVMPELRELLERPPPPSTLMLGNEAQQGIWSLDLQLLTCNNSFLQNNHVVAGMKPEDLKEAPFYLHQLAHPDSRDYAEMARINLNAVQGKPSFWYTVTFPGFCSPSEAVGMLKRGITWCSFKDLPNGSRVPLHINTVMEELEYVTRDDPRLPTRVLQDPPGSSPTRPILYLFSESEMGTNGPNILRPEDPVLHYYTQRLPSRSPAPSQSPPQQQQQQQQQSYPPSQLQAPSQFQNQLESSQTMFSPPQAQPQSQHTSFQAQLPPSQSSFYAPQPLTQLQQFDSQPLQIVFSPPQTPSQAQLQQLQSAQSLFASPQLPSSSRSQQLLPNRQHDNSSPPFSPLSIESSLHDPSLLSSSPSLSSILSTPQCLAPQPTKNLDPTDWTSSFPKEGTLDTDFVFNNLLQLEKSFQPKD